jgi:transcriptional regulator with XRE-family HTH domain
MRPLPVSPRSERVAIGSRFRAFREARQLTLDQLATASGLSKSFISRIERDQTSPSVATLLQLCDVLNVDVGDLFRAPESQFVPASKAPPINFGGIHVDEHLLTPRTERRLQAIRTVIHPGQHGSGGTELYTINAEVETLHVICGAIRFRLNHATWEMRQGDSITFSGREPHTWESLDPSLTTELLWVLVPAPWSTTK